VINSVKSAKKITGIKNVYAIIGGFHLSVKIYEDIIDRTLDELVKLEAIFNVICHCTGWKAVNKIIQSVPDSFIKAVSGQSSSFFERAKRKLQIVNQNFRACCDWVIKYIYAITRAHRLRTC
jgi:hypothetical protein